MNYAQIMVYIVRYIFLILLFGALLNFCGCSGDFPPGITEVIDGHVHFTAVLGPGEDDYAGAAQTAIAKMDELGITRSIIMPTPFPPNWPQTYDAEPLAEVVSAYPDRFSFVAGGGTLNVMIQQALNGQAVSEDEFEEAALEILGKGALGFGEMAAEHIVIGGTEPYLHAPPNHLLFKKLADIAAEHNVPIDIHMEAVPQDMPIPVQFATPDNPDTLQANIAMFEELLNHNPAANIIWSHVGWDTTGERTAELSASLLEKYDTLYMGIKLTDTARRNSFFDSSGDITEGWLDVFERFPDRFLLGSDQFYLAPGIDRELPSGADTTAAILNKLPRDLVKKFSYENAKTIYGIE